ncbi:putative transmembrane protein [Burkholderia mallei]|nr:putative transmembrane protein [Burkholderia mallei]RPA38000.1 hypothetical protein EGT59_23135 [Burkholderia mallei]
MWHFPQAVPASLGPWAVFASVLVTQLGMPVPAVPMLIVGGTMAAMGQASYASMLVAAVAVWVFLFWDVAGASLWASVWLFGGAALHDEIVRLMQWVSASGGTLFDAFAAIFVTFLLYRWAMRMRFRRWLAKIRISPQQLDAMLKSAAPPIVFDARPRAVREKEAYRIAGAYPLDLDSPDPLHPDLMTRPIVVYCVCPNEATAKRIVSQLQRKRIRHALALKGGLDAWEKHGYPVEPLPADFDAARYAAPPPVERIAPLEPGGRDGGYPMRAGLTD